MELEEEAIAGMQVEKSDCHLLFQEVATQGRRREFGPLARRHMRRAGHLPVLEGTILPRNLMIY